jgi:spermidine/putrescine transport system permease protein
MYGQMREGATPAVNAVSVLVMVVAGGLASLFALIVRPR